MVFSQCCVTPEMEAYVASQVSEFRFKHIQGVRQSAQSLAKRWQAPADKTDLAALFHDVAREWPLARLLAYAREKGMSIRPQDEKYPILLHGAVAVHLLEQTFGLRDEEVAEAMRVHTTGFPGMGLVAKILFVADAIEPGRSHIEVTRLRMLADKDLEQAVTEVLKEQLAYIRKREADIDPWTLELATERGIQTHRDKDRC